MKLYRTPEERKSRLYLTFQEQYTSEFYLSSSIISYIPTVKMTVTSGQKNTQIFSKSTSIAMPLFLLKHLRSFTRINITQPHRKFFAMSKLCGEKWYLAQNL